MILKVGLEIIRNSGKRSKIILSRKSPSRKHSKLNRFSWKQQQDLQLILVYLLSYIPRKGNLGCRHASETRREKEWPSWSLFALNSEVMSHAVAPRREAPRKTMSKGRCMLLSLQNTRTVAILKMKRKTTESKSKHKQKKAWHKLSLRGLVSGTQGQWRRHRWCPRQVQGRRLRPRWIQVCWSSAGSHGQDR